jgi:hypothetical protein
VEAVSLPKNVQEQRDFAITLAVLAGADFVLAYGKWYVYDADSKFIAHGSERGLTAYAFLDAKGISFERD